jgi:hypothetical protein
MKRFRRESPARSAREHQAADRRSKYYQELKLAELRADYAAAYASPFPTLVLQKGNKGYLLPFYQTSSTYEMGLDDWGPIFAETSNKPSAFSILPVVRATPGGAGIVPD